MYNLSSCFRVCNAQSAFYTRVRILYPVRSTFSLYSSLSITTTDLSSSAGRIFKVSSLLKFCSAFFCSIVILTVAGYLQILRMFATETRIVSLAVWLRLKMPFSTEDNIFATGIYFEAIEKLKRFSTAEISTGFQVSCDTSTTHFSFSGRGINSV